MAERIKKAYSYLRFSTPEQSKGDSIRRQVDAARRYAKQHSLELDDSLTFQDMGVSARRGRNALEGRLGAFIEAVDEGRVRPGSYLLVEAFDRLSRNRIMKALVLIQSILDKGVNIVTLTDSRVYTKQSLDNVGDVMYMVVAAATAHEETEKRSSRGKEWWQNKRNKAAESGTAMTASAPSWLRLDKETGKYEVINEKAATVRRIFALYLEGYGKTKITQMFNEERVPPLSGRADGWHHSYVGRLLINEAVVGRFQPMREVEPPEGSSPGTRRRVNDGDPIEGYYPTIIDAETFARVRAVRRSNRMTSGPKGKTFSNVLSGLATCGLCGATMHRVNKGKPPKGFHYLTCSSAMRNSNGCAARLVRFDMILPALLNSLVGDDLDLARVLGLGDDDDKDRQQVLREAIEGVEGEIAETGEASDSLLAAIEKAKSPNARDTLAARLDDLEVRKAKLKQQHQAFKDQLQESSHPSADRVSSLGEVQAIVREWDAVTDDPKRTYDVNLRLNAALKRSIERVEVERSESAREWIEGEFVPWREKRGPTFPHPMFGEKYRTVIDESRMGISMTITFRNAPDRHLIIYADGSRHQRYVTVAARISPEGTVANANISVSAL